MIVTPDNDDVRWDEDALQAAIAAVQKRPPYAQMEPEALRRDIEAVLGAYARHEANNDLDW